jgi:hypothetical protein
MSNIAIDFDGTIVTHEFPKIGKLLPGAVKTIQALRANGHKVFLWTMRSEEPVKGHNVLQEAVDFCKRVGIEFDAINKSSSGWGTGSPKQHADLYIDDAALGCPMKAITNTRGKFMLAVDWKEVANELLGEYITPDQYESIIAEFTR